MTDLMPTPGVALEADPIQYMAIILHRAKCWLEEAQSLDEVRHAKAVAVGYESVIREKEMASDALLSATEIVRRCERRVGELVKQGQAEGTIRGATGNRGVTAVTPGVKSPADTIGTGKAAQEQRVLSGATSEQFDAAVDQARGEEDLSRANVVRKIRGEDTPEDPDPMDSKGDRAFNNAIKAQALLDNLPGILTRVADRWDDIPDEELANPVAWRQSADRLRSALDRFLERIEPPVEGLRRVK